MTVESVLGSNVAAKPMQTMDYHWKIKSDLSEHDIIVCDLGKAIRFYWEPGTHDVVKMNSR
jgi:hypothetical protein